MRRERPDGAVYRPLHPHLPREPGGKRHVALGVHLRLVLPRQQGLYERLPDQPARLRSYSDAGAALQDRQGFGCGVLGNDGVPLPGQRSAHLHQLVRIHLLPGFHQCGPLPTGDD